MFKRIFQFLTFWNHPKETKKENDINYIQIRVENIQKQELVDEKIYYISCNNLENKCCICDGELQSRDDCIKINKHLIHKCCLTNFDQVTYCKHCNNAIFM
jgi:hypothetical protein